ncbi:MAG: RNA polymerase sigma-70 factor [Carboxylicivirga sp.]|jgi:RNA polymerase sigma-70 factor (ECF subfamily)|nr:RNA polymerase sigma-70 factor [Carboxylicivirga sp.]
MRPEDKILKLLKQGNKLGLELLFKQFYKPLVVYASKFVESEEEAEDLVQEVFISFWESDKLATVQNYIRGYLYNSVKNKCLNYRKKIDKIKIKGIDNYSESLFENFPDEDGFQEKIAKINAEIDKLPERSKEIFVGVYIHRLKYDEIAEELDISKNTVKTTLSRTMKSLREKLSKESFALLLLLIS